MSKYFAPSELIINQDGSVFHLHLHPEHLADKIILVGDPGRVSQVSSHFESIECEVSNREFKSVTGVYKGKRITVVSTGIGCDNIDIVVNELDALANIDFDTREEKENLRQLTFVRIGTCGGLQEYVPTGTYIASEKSIGFDGLLNFYAGRNEACDLEFEAAFKKHMNWNELLGAPYVIDADNYLFKNMFKTDVTRSTYFSVYREDCENEWFLLYGDDYKVQDIIVDSKAGRILSGVSFWDKPTAKKIVKFIDKAYKSGEFVNLYWDNMVKDNINELDVYVEELEPNSIYEIDSVKDYKKLEEILKGYE